MIREDLIREDPITVRGLSKHFYARRRLRELLMPWRKRTRVEALRGVDLSVRSGELVALLGPNGAGKTTLLKILATLVDPSEGSAKVLGQEVQRDRRRARAQVGYVLAEERSFYWRLSCRDNLRFFAALQGMPPSDARERIAELGSLLGLTEHLDRDFMDLSTGQRQRMAIARGLLADPPVLLFDEATRSLDPGRAKRVRTLVRRLLVERGGKAVLFATHDLEEARELADRVAFMQGGRIVCEGPYEGVEATIRASFEEEADAELGEFDRLLEGSDAR